MKEQYKPKPENVRKLKVYLNKTKNKGKNGVD